MIKQLLKAGLLAGGDDKKQSRGKGEEKDKKPPVDPKIAKYRKEASRLAAVANKRLARLEKANLTNSPAYKKWAENGGVKFGVKGKNYNEVQSEVSRLNKFLSSNTSTIRGLNTTLKDMAKNTGVKYKNLTDLKSKADNFFRLADKVEEYLRTVEDMASAIGYNKIWEVINEYVSTAKVDLGKADTDIDDLTKMVTELITKSKGNDNYQPESNEWVLLN